MQRDQLYFNQPKEIYELIKDKTASEYIDTMGYTTNSIEDFCERNLLNVSRRKNDFAIENQTNPPLFASYFYYYLYCYQTLPAQEQFSEFYRALNEKWVRANILSTQKEAFESRLARFYASIIREFHFYHLVKESNLFDKVDYSLKQDIEQKMDCFVQKEEVAIGVQLRVKTTNSKRYADKKLDRGFDDSGVTLVDVALDLDTAKEVKTKKDAFLFYDSSYIQTLLEAFENEQERVPK